MNDMATALVWCMGQVTLVGIAGGAVYLAASRSGPSLRSRVAFTSLVVITLLTVMVASPWPRWSVPSPNEDTRASEPSLSADTNVAASRAVTAPSTDAAAEMGPANEPMLPGLPQEDVVLGEMPAAAADAAASIEPEHRSTGSGVAFGETERGASSARPIPWLPLAALLVLAGLVLGALRLVAGLVSVSRCRRRATVVGDPRVCRLVEELSSRLGCLRPIEIRESTEITSAATTGYRRPTILLPAGWTNWSDEQLRAVLAHETAHVARNDFASWLSAQAALVLHFYHPLVHWLVGRLRLDQELLADAAAAPLSGGRDRYLTILAEMALATSHRSPAWPARAFLPGRGMLIQRIETLRDSRHSVRPPSTVVAACAVCLILVAGAAAAGLRSPSDRGSLLLAQAGNTDPPASSLGNGPSAVRTTRSAAIPQATSYVPDDAAVVISVQPSRLATTAATRPFADLLKKLSLFRREFSEHLDAIDEVILVPFTTSRVESQPREGPKLVLGTTIIRMKTHADLESIIDKVIPAPVARSWRSREYVASSAGPENGDPICALEADDRTLLVDYESRIRQFIGSANPRSSKLITSEAWQTVHRHAVAVTADGRWLAGTLGALPERGSVIRTGILEIGIFSPLWEETELLAIGGNADDKIELSGIADCGNEEGAQRVTETLTAFITLARNGIVSYRDQINRKAPPQVRDRLLALVDLADAMLHEAKVVQQGDSVTASTAAVLDELLLKLVEEGAKSALTGRTQANAAINLKHIGLAMHNYHDVHGHLPAATVLGPDGKTVHSWRVAILPFIDQKELYEQYRLNQPWDSPHNRQVAKRIPAIYRHPEASADSTSACYFALTGPTTPFRDQEGLRFRDILDGTSNTILIVEARRDIPWTKPEDIPFDPAQPLPSLGGFDPNGSHVLVADGSTRWLPKTVDPALLKNWITPDGGEVVPALPAGVTIPPQGVPITSPIDDAGAQNQTRRSTGGIRGSRRAAAADVPSSRRNLKQIGIGLHNYHDVHARFPAANVVGPDGKTVHSWRVAILPYIGQEELYEQYRLNEPWDSPHNLQVAKRIPAAYRHPQAPADSTSACYFALTGPATMFRGNEGLRIRDIRDGTSNTIMIVEARRDVPWTKPEDIPFDAAQAPPKLGGLEPNGVHLLLADGRVVLLPNIVDTSQMEKWITPDGGEVVLPLQSPGENK